MSFRLSTIPLYPRPIIRLILSAVLHLRYLRASERHQVSTGAEPLIREKQL